MITQIVGTPKELLQQDWSKPRLYKNKKGDIVLSTGENSGVVFSGTCIHSYSEDSRFTYCSNWNKSAFTPITEPTTITFYS